MFRSLVFSLVLINALLAVTAMSGQSIGGRRSGTSTTGTTTTGTSTTDTSDPPIGCTDCMPIPPIFGAEKIPFSLAKPGNWKDEYGLVLAQRKGTKTSLMIEALLDKPMPQNLSIYLVNPETGSVQEEFKVRNRWGKIDTKLETDLDRFQLILSPKAGLKKILDTDVALTSSKPKD